MRKKTDVSRLSTAVTTATSASAATRSARGGSGSCASRRSCGGEQAVALGDDADEQQARDEGERRPGLRGSCAYAGQHDGRGLAESAQDLGRLRPAALTLLREDERVVDEDVELALLARLRSRPCARPPSMSAARLAARSSYPLQTGQ